MSVDGETSRVMKGVQHGACDYLLKPIRMKELRNIWQHVLRKRINEGRDIDSHEVIDGLQMTRSGSDRSDDHFYSGEDVSTGKKRKESENKHDDKDFADHGSSTKKARVVWSVELHQKFVKAVNQIGFDKVGPKRILDLMNVPWLTRENVASHLQKYRLYLSRLQKENDLKTCFGGINPDSASQDPSVSFSSQSSISVSQEDIPNRNFRFSGNDLLAQIANPKVHEVDQQVIVSLPKEEPKRTLIAEVPNQQESRGMKIGFKPSVVPLGPQERFTGGFNSSIPAHYSWRGAPKVPFKEETDPHISLEDPSHLLKSTNSQPNLTGGQRTNSVEYKPLCADHRSNVAQASLVRSQSDLNGVQDKGNMVNYQDIQPIPVGSSSIRGQVFDLASLPASQPANGNLSSISRSPFRPSSEDLQIRWLQDDPLSANLGFQNSEFSGYSDPCLVAEVPIHLYDALRFDYEQFVDPTECSIIDHGLFIT
ncbi:two-component response regulator ARR11 isoform X2 [Punica granatum]|nr:two-component response regulator ARR11 isoform X2 [Punica granatum]PKI77062.1 hypothetical protein CRG98_002565 [Punica granatum]